MIVEQEALREELEELSSAEEFLNYFDIEFDRRVVQVNRLHILQRFHDLLAQSAAEGSAYERYRACLVQAYSDFVGSSAQEQKVLRVFKTPEPGFVSFDEFTA